LPGKRSKRPNCPRTADERHEVAIAGVGFLAINDEGRIVCDYLFTEL